jgi:HK97 gp10 family phage protein
MSGPVTVKFEGGMELDAAFRSLMDDFDASKATVKNTMRRGMKEALVPMADAAEANAPLLTGHLRDSITEGTKLTSRQARLEKQRDDKSFVTMFMGPNDPAAVPQEFGTFDQPAQPFMRPAFQAEAQGTITRLAGALKAQLDKAVSRAQAKALKKAV